MPWCLGGLSTRKIPPSFSSHKLFLQSQFHSNQLEESNMPARAKNIRACKKYVEILLSGGEKKYVDMYMAMTNTK